MGFLSRLFGTPSTGSGIDPRLGEILRFLSDAKTRATYGAVADIVGGIPQSIGGRLGARRVEASWVVNASSGMPTGYRQAQLHPDLISRTEIITSGSELQRRLSLWRSRAAG